MLKRIIPHNNYIKYIRPRYSHTHTKTDFTQKKGLVPLEDKLNELQQFNETNFNELRETNETFYYFMKSKHQYNEFKLIELQQITETKLNQNGFMCYLILILSGLTLYNI